MQKKPEMTQEHLAMQQKLNEAQEQMRITKTTEAEMEKIRSDADGSAGSGYDGKGGSDKEEDEQEKGTDSGLLVAPGHNVIDIKV